MNYLNSKLSVKYVMIKTRYYGKENGQKAVKTIRIHLEDLSYIDFWASDSQIEDFHNWLRFANLNEYDDLPGTNQAVKRRDIATVELVKDEVFELK